MLDKNFFMGYNLFFIFVIFFYYVVGYIVVFLNVGWDRMDWNFGVCWICFVMLLLIFLNVFGGVVIINFLMFILYCEVLRMNWFVCLFIDRILWLLFVKIFVFRFFVDLVKVLMNVDIFFKGWIFFFVSVVSCL